MFITNVVPRPPICLCPTHCGHEAIDELCSKMKRACRYHRHNEFGNCWHEPSIESYERVYKEYRFDFDDVGVHKEDEEPGCESAVEGY